MKRAICAVAAVGLLCVAIGCGTKSGGMNPPPPPPPPPPPAKQVFRASAIPNNHTFNFKKAAAKSESASVWDRLFPTAYAQSPAPAVLVGNYSGYCAQVDTSFLSGPGTYTVFGFGFVPSFSSSNQNPCGSSAIFGGPPRFDSPAPVIGDGTLQGLVVIDGTDSVTAAGSGIFTVYVVRNGVLTNTGITVTLGGLHRKDDTVHTFPVLDGDGIVIGQTFNPGDAPKNIQVFLGKQ